MGNKKTIYNENKENAVFAKKLRKIAKEKGATQQALADYICKHTGEPITRQSVGQWFIGATCPSLRTVPIIAKYFGVSTDYLLTETETKTPDEKIRAAVVNLGISEISVENIRAITQSGENVNILLERDEFKSIVELLNKIKTISVGKRYYNTRIRTEFEEIREALSQKNWNLHSFFFWTIRYIEERHLTGDITVNSDNPYDVKPEQDETEAVPAVNSDKVYDERIWLSEYQLTEKVFKKLIELIENDTTSDDHLFKNYDYKIGNKLDEELSYHNGKGEIPNRMPPEDIKALEEFIKFYNEHYRKDGENNG